MNHDDIADLKTYWATLLSQELGGLRDDLEQQINGLRTDMEKRFDEVDKRFDEVDKKFEKLETKLTRKIDTLSDSVGEALHNFDTSTHEQLQNHEQRITKLEATTA